MELTTDPYRQTLLDAKAHLRRALEDVFLPPDAIEIVLRWHAVLGRALETYHTTILAAFQAHHDATQRHWLEEEHRV